MAKEIVQLSAEQPHNDFIKNSRKWVKSQAKSIEGHFPILKDNTRGLQIGWSLSAVYAAVLRPDGTLVFVDLDHTGQTKEQDSPFREEAYLSRSTLRDIQTAVDKIKSTLTEKEKKPFIVSKVRQIFTGR